MNTYKFTYVHILTIFMTYRNDKTFPNEQEGVKGTAFGLV